MVSLPRYASLRSVSDEQFHLYPAPDSSEVTTMKVAYAARVQRVSEASSIVLIPEAREALITGGEFFMMRLRYAKYPNVWGQFQRDFLSAIDGARAAANRHLAAANMTIFPDFDGQLSYPYGDAGFNPSVAYYKITR